MRDAKTALGARESRRLPHPVAAWRHDPTLPLRSRRTSGAGPGHLARPGTPDRGPRLLDAADAGRAGVAALSRPCTRHGLEPGSEPTRGLLGLRIAEQR